MVNLELDLSDDSEYSSICLKFAYECGTTEYRVDNWVRAFYAMQI